MTQAIQTRPQPQQTPDLFKDGYRCELMLDGNLLVISPEERRYRVDPRSNSCTCPASVTCKHIRGAKALCLAQCEDLWREGCDWQIAAIADGHNEGMWQRGQEMVHRASEMYAWATEGK